MRPIRALTVVVAVSLLAGLQLSPAQPAKQATPPKAQRVDKHGDPLPDAAIARLGSTRFRHGGMDLLAYTPDGKSLIFHSSGVLKFMDPTTGQQTKLLRYGDSEVRMVRRFGMMDTQTVLSGDTKVLAVASGRGMANGVTLIDTETGKEKKKFTLAELFKNGQNLFDPPGIALSHDGKYLLAFPLFDDGGPGNRIPISWLDTTTGQRLHEIEAEKDCRFSRARISRDNRQIFALELNNNGQSRLRVFDAVRGMEMNTIELPGNARDFRFELRNDGQTLLVSSSQGGPVRLFDYTAGKDLKELRAFSDLPPGGCFMQSPDGKQLFITGREKVHHWDMDAGKELRTIDAPGIMKDDANMGIGMRFREMMPRQMLAVAPDGKQLACSSSHGVTLFDATNGKKLAGGGASSPVNVVRFSPDGKGLIVSDSEHVVQQWDVGSAKVVKSFDPFKRETVGRMPDLAIFSSFTSGAAFSEDGKLLAVSMGENGVGLWDTATGATIKRYGPPDDKDKDKEMFNVDFPFAFAFAPQGNMLAVSTPSGGINLWDASTGKLIRGWTWHDAPPRPERRNESGILSLAFSPDGKTLAGCCIYSVFEDMPQTAIVLWETATGTERMRLKSEFKGMGTEMEFEFIFMLLDQMGLSVTYSPDGKHLMVGTFTSLHIMDAHTGKDVVSYAGRQMVGRTAAFSRDSKHLFIGRADGSLRVLDVPSGRVVQDWQAHSDPILSLTLSSDGKMLATGSGDSTVLLWDVAELSKPPTRVKAALTKDDLDKLWSDLAGDAGKAYKAISGLADAGPDATTMLKSRLSPIAPVDAKVFEDLLDGLNSPKFPVRDKATAELEKFGDLAKNALVARLAKKPPLEVQQRIDQLIAKLNSGVQTPQMLQTVRAVEALERVGTPESLAVLTDLAKGAAGHRLTEDADKAAKRLQKQLKGGN